MKLQFDPFSEIHLQYDSLSGCVFVIALNTKEGVRCSGGTRMKDYQSLDDGIIDALELTRTMTKKCKVIGEKYNGGFSGGKGVIIGNPASQKSKAMLRRYGEFVTRLNGRFVTGTDLNIDEDDAKCMAETSPYIDGLCTGQAGSTTVGASYGVLYSIEKVLQLYEVGKELNQLSIAVQGLGGVGMELVRLLKERGATIIATDVCKAKATYARAHYGISLVNSDEIYDVPCDVFSPNAEGGMITEAVAGKIRARFIIGSANNPLLENSRRETSARSSLHDRIHALIRKSDSHLARKMDEKGIIYIPDYIASVGGAFTSICEQRGKNFEYMRSTLKTIIDSCFSSVYRLALNEAIPFLSAAERYLTLLNERTVNIS